MREILSLILSLQCEADPIIRYKPIGSQTGATENSKDGFETLRVRPEFPSHISTVILTHFPLGRPAKPQLDRQTPSALSPCEP